MNKLILFLGFLILLPFSIIAKPNIVLIIEDDSTYRDLEVYGGQAKTPNIIELAQEGMKFSQCFQAAPMCSPTRHNLYTGIYPVKSGAYPNHTYVKDGINTLPHYFKPLGYRVMLSGKTHIAPKEAFPFEYSSGPSPDGGNQRGDIDFDAIEELFKSSKDNVSPFCLMVCSKEPHTPYNRGDRSAYPPHSLKLRPYHVDTPEMRTEFSKYLAEIMVFDSQVGQTLALLDKYGHKENTLVVVLSEQGNSFSHAKWTCYEDGLKSGCIIRYPGTVAPGSRSSTAIEYVDILPTFLEVAGANIPNVLDGESILPVLWGETNQHKEVVYGLHTTVGINNNAGPFGIRTVRSSQYRYILNLNSDSLFRCALDRNAWFQSWVSKAETGDAHAVGVVTRHMYRPEEELYDIVNDPDNLVNLAPLAKFDPIKKELRAMLDAWMKGQGDLGRETELIAETRLARNRKR